MRGIVSAFLIGLVSVGACLPAFASGWNDYEFKIEGKYRVIRANSRDIILYGEAAEDGHATAITSPERVGPLEAVALTPEYLFARTCKSEDYYSGVQAEEIRYYTILERATNTVYGPFNEDEFSAKLADLGMGADVQWQTLREARREALRQGWADVADVNRALEGQLFFTMVMAAIWSLPAVLFALAAAYGVRAMVARQWSRKKMFVVIWLLLAVFLFAVSPGLWRFDSYRPLAVFVPAAIVALPAVFQGRHMVDKQWGHLAMCLGMWLVFVVPVPLFLALGSVYDWLWMRYL